MPGLHEAGRRDKINLPLCWGAGKVPDQGKVLRAAKGAGVGAFLFGFKVSGEISFCDRCHGLKHSNRELVPNPLNNKFSAIMLRIVVHPINCG